MSNNKLESDATDSGEEWQQSMQKLRVFPFPETGPFVSTNMSPPDGMVHLGWDQNKAFPAYRIGEDLVPFTPLAQALPENDPSFVIDNYTDAAIKARWLAADDATKQRIRAALATTPPEHEFRTTGTLDARGRIDAHKDVDLDEIRRPRFFGAHPWNEPIAEIDATTSIVEIDVPQGPYERLQLGLEGRVKIRGWHIAGKGVPGPDGTRKRALVVLTAGRAIETTAIAHPEDEPAHIDENSGDVVENVYPGGKGSECWGARGWRNSYLLAFVKAGFDVLTLDKRGHGISGGVCDANTNEQAYDLLRALRALEDGDGLRIAMPDGAIRQGTEAAGLLLAGHDRLSDLPVFIGGASQGCMVTLWATLKIIGTACDFDRPTGDTNETIPKLNLCGVLLMAAFAGGLAYRPPDDDLMEAARRLEFNMQMFPSSEAFATIPKWPAMMIMRGLWDFAESIEASLAAFSRATGPKAIVTVRGPHGESEWGPENMAYAGASMTAFCTAVLHGQSHDLPQPRTLRDLVEAAPADWAPYARPGKL